MPRIKVAISSSHLDIPEPWAGLAARAAVNVFMDPVALNAVHATGFARTHALLAWDEDEEPARLVGLWALQERNVAVLGPAFLAAPPYEYAFASAPVVDPACLDAVVAAFLDAIAAEPALPNVVRLQHLDGETDVYQALARALAARRGETLKLSETSRPFVSRQAGQKHSGSTRKKLRQDWNRLSALGAVDVANAADCDAVRAAFEVFLAMEANSWKGERGTALLCDPADAAFARRLVGDLAAQGKASVALLRVDGRPIAAQVLLYGGSMAYTWKTAFDAEHARYSPGALLVDKVTEQLFSGGVIEAIESCSPERSFMAQLWTGRRTTVDLLVDLGTRRSLGYAVAVMGERGYAQLRRLRDRLQGLAWSPLPKRRGVARPA